MMELKPDHMRYLVCPVCHQALGLAADAVPATLDCLGCGRRYPIHEGLPVLIAARATHA